MASTIHPYVEEYPLEMSKSITPHPNAGVIKRFAAMLYDSFLLLGVLAAAAAIPSFILNPGPREHDSGDVIYELHPLLDGPLFQSYLFFVIASFFIAFWKKNGQTLGMQAWKIRIETLDGTPLTLKQCIIRVVIAMLSLSCAGLGYWWQWFDKEGLNWHDRASGTRVIQLPKT